MHIILKPRFRVATLAAALAFCCGVHAKDDGTDTAITIENLSCRYTVNANGTYEAMQDEAIRVNEARAVDTDSQRTLSYNRAFETLEVLDAYTEKPDGRRIKVKPEQMREQQAAGVAGAPMFQDVRTMSVIFPEVAVGDRMVMSYRYRVKTPVFAGQFSADLVPGFVRHKEYTLIFDVPAGMPLSTDAQGFHAAPAETKDGRKIYRWDFDPGENARIEAGSVAYSDYGKHMRVTTFHDYAEVARAYAAKIQGKSEPTAAIKELAARLTAGLSEPRAKAMALTDWTRRNIRYVGVNIGANGYVPHDAGTVLENLYGDAKDIACLLQALLAAAGMESTQVLVNAGNAYLLPKTASPYPFGHVINYLPSLGLYLDGTDAALAAGDLRQDLWDKPVLMVESGEIGHTPATQGTSNLHVTEFKLDDKGEADFTHSSTYRGWGAEPTRYAYRNMHPTDLERKMDNVLRGYGFQGKGSIDAGDINGTGKEYVMSGKGHIANLADLPGPVGLPVLTGFVGGIRNWLRSETREQNRTQPYQCFSGETTEQAGYDFPADVKILGVPKPLAIHDADIDYTSDYQQSEHRVVVKRHLSFHHKGVVCTPQDYKAIQPDLDKMVRDLMGQIVVQQD